MAYREQVKIINDDYVPIRSIELAKIGTHMVYNLVLATIDGSDIPADKAVFYAHGLAVGDNQMQFYAAKAAEQRLRETRGLTESGKRIWKQQQTIFRFIIRKESYGRIRGEHRFSVR